MTHQPSLSINNFQIPIPSFVEIEECHSPLERTVCNVYNKSGTSCSMTITIESVKLKRYVINLNLKRERINTLLELRTHAPKIQPDLVEISAIRCPAVYKRFRDMEQKDQFRGKLLEQMHDNWIQMHGTKKAEMLQAKFKELASILDENGAAIFGELIAKKAFQELIDHYNQVLKTQGSKSWIHSYINLANHPDFLSNTSFNGAFLHPLLIALISYRIGGPIRIVDARGKDADPISVMAQDNMLHIDNTPFNDEYKVILTWEKDKPSGPKGQNFVFIPGTHKGARNCFIDKNGNAWSTENASIFITEENIQQMFDFQKKILPKASPTVIEAHHLDKPLTIIFASGSLVHHRYRTEDKFARSCIIMAYHNAADNPGQFIACAHLGAVSTKNGDLNSYLFGWHGAGTEEQFLRALASNSNEIATIIDKLNTEQDETKIIVQEKKKLNGKDFRKWKTAATLAPNVEQLKIEKNFFPLGKELTQEEFIQFIHKMMIFDKHGPLDLILYSDSREEIRKWARNQIREIRVDRLESRIREWTTMMESLAKHHLLAPKRLKSVADRLAVIAAREIKTPHNAILDPNEKISQEDAFHSIKQLLIDLGEAIIRCESRQTFLSTSLFLFMACDTLRRLQGTSNEEIKRLGGKLLANYVATGILIEQQIQQELNN